MKSIMPSYLWPIRIFLYAVFLTLLPSWQTLQAEEPCSIVVGALFPESGPAALIGERSRQAALLAMKKLPPSIQARIQLRFEDTQMKPMVGLNATRLLIEDPKLSTLTGFGSELVGAIAPVLESAEVPGIFATPDPRPMKGKSFLFRHWVDDQDMFRVIAKELQRQGHKRIAIIYSEIPAMTLFSEYFQKHAPTAGLEVVFVRNVLPNETDFRPFISGIVSKQPEATMVFLLPPQPSSFAREFRRKSEKGPLFAYINIENSYEVQAAQGALEQVRYAGPRFEDWFVRDFLSEYKVAPEFATGTIYDVITLYGRAVEQNICSRKGIRDFISQQKSIRGALGTYGIQDGFDFRFPAQLKEIRGDKFIPTP